MKKIPQKCIVSSILFLTLLVLTCLWLSGSNILIAYIYLLRFHVESNNQVLNLSKALTYGKGANLNCSIEDVAVKQAISQFPQKKKYNSQKKDFILETCVSFLGGYTIIQFQPYMVFQSDGTYEGSYQNICLLRENKDKKLQVVSLDSKALY